LVEYPLFDTVVQKNYSVSFGNRDWSGIDLYTPIKSLFDCPIYFENDANLATLYEGSFYRGKVVFLTFSTGIGGGVVKGGEILPESSSFEPGHKIYEYKGRSLEWEDIAAASALEKYYHVDMATELRKKEIMQDIAMRMTLGLVDVVKEYNPDVVVLGGPMGKIFRLYVKYLPRDLEVKYRRPKRPNESVIYGCYLYAKQKERE
jgi:predicted NBD/HSP70 family sugar kinase